MYAVGLDRSALELLELPAETAYLIAMDDDAANRPVAQTVSLHVWEQVWHPTEMHPKFGKRVQDGTYKPQQLWADLVPGHELIVDKFSLGDYRFERGIYQLANVSLIDIFARSLQGRWQSRSRVFLGAFESISNAEQWEIFRWRQLFDSLVAKNASRQISREAWLRSFEIFKAILHEIIMEIRSFSGFVAVSVESVDAKPGLVLFADSISLPIGKLDFAISEWWSLSF